MGTNGSHIAITSLNLTGRSINEHFVLKLTSRISQGAHATKITVLTNQIRAQRPMPRKLKSLYPIYSLVIADHHMSGKPSYITLKCEKHSITVLRYMFVSVYVY